MNTPEDDRRLAQRLRALCRSIGDQMRAGALTEERLAYALRGVVGVADALDLRGEEAERAAGNADDNVVDLQTRRALETVAPGRDASSQRFGEGLRAPSDPRMLGRPPWRPDPSEPDPDGSGGAA